jgi:serine/threonine protein kinase
MEQGATVIGEGGYGCVHKPSLKCKSSSKTSYKNKVSKVLFSTFAKKELKEYDKIGRIDKTKQFYLGKPKDCQFNTKDKENQNSLNKCSVAEDMLKTPEDLTLLIMEDGGINLEIYANQFVTMGNSKTQFDNIKRVEIFWMEAFRLLLGIKELLQHGIVHNDLKPQNIVYDEKKQRINLIDFGLMSVIDDIITSSSHNTNYYANQTYWAYPLETSLYNKIKFDKFCEMNQSEREEYIIKLCKDTSVKTFLFYENQCITDKERMKTYLNDLYSFFIFNFNYPKTNDYVLSRQEYEKENHLQFLVNSLSTIDIYGLGISFNYMFSKTRHLLNEGMRKEFSKLFYLMITPNPYKRIKIDSLVNSYEMILKTNGLFEKHSTKFSSFLLPREMESKLNKIIKGITSSIQTKESIIVKDADKTVLEMNCFPKKTYNPLSKRCVKSCKKGYTRNKSFKCISKKKSKSVGGSRKRRNQK